ncbi:SDR family NAD(P)-dependent oxidoreductase [Nocardia fluminea]|uniref:SDR family NAD(P)-dependent oxidoreductase n=1 Tax=Nocardia fluminea TaxID=134984 RepID=UPI003D104E50
MRLHGKRALVTGGTSGIGRAVVEAFAAEGAVVTFCGRSTERGNALAATGNGNIRFVEADVTVPRDVDRLIETVLADGPIDCLVNNAAAAETSSLHDMTPEVLDACMWSVFGSVVLMSKAVSPAMGSAGGGSIINIGSTAGHRANSSPPIYSSLKAAVSHLSRCLALELSGDHIRVNTVSPGAIATPIFQGTFGMAALPGEQAMALIAEALASVNPSGRGGTPTDIAKAVVFLASDDSTYITGQDLVVDGGLTAGNTPVGRAEEHRRVAEVIAKGASDR